MGSKQKGFEMQKIITLAERINPETIDRERREKSTWAVTMVIKTLDEPISFLRQYEDLKREFTWTAAILDMTKTDDLHNLKFRVEDGRGHVEIEYCKVEQPTADYFNPF